MVNIHILFLVFGSGNKSDLALNRSDLFLNGVNCFSFHLSKCAFDLRPLRHYSGSALVTIP